MGFFKDFKDDFFKFEQDIRIERKLFYDFLVR